MVAQACHHGVLEVEHLAGVGLVIEPAEMQDAVNRRLRQIVRVLRADDHVAKLARAGDGIRTVDGKREDVGGAVDAAMRRG